MAALDIDLFFFHALNDDADVVDMTQGRVFNTCRKGKDEDEDKIPYIIITNDGASADADDKDGCVSPMDSGVCSVLIVAKTRDQLAELQRMATEAIADCAENIDWSEMTDWDFQDLTATPNAGAIQYDEMKPCIFRTITYQCQTTAK